MKVFITTSDKFKKEYPTLFKDLVDTVKRYAGEEPYLASSEKDSKKKLSNSEIVIAEDSVDSTDVGFDLATATTLKKPVLVLRLSGKSEGERSYSSKSRRLREITLTEYTEKTLDTEVKEFIKKAKNIIDTKFILIISPEIDKYLQWVSDNRRMHKAQIVRKAVEEKMTGDEDYKNGVES